MADSEDDDWTLDFDKNRITRIKLKKMRLYKEAYEGYPNKSQKLAAYLVELEQECAMRESELDAALKLGRSTRIGEGRWDHGTIQTKKVAAAQKALAGFPHATERGKTLLAQTAYVLELRATLGFGGLALTASIVFVMLGSKLWRSARA